MNRQINKKSNPFFSCKAIETVSLTEDIKTDISEPKTTPLFTFSCSKSEGCEATFSTCRVVPIKTISPPTIIMTEKLMSSSPFMEQVPLLRLSHDNFTSFSNFDIHDTNFSSTNSQSINTQKLSSISEIRCFFILSQKAALGMSNPLLIILR